MVFSGHEYIVWVLTCSFDELPGHGRLPRAQQICEPQGSYTLYLEHLHAPNEGKETYWLLNIEFRDSIDRKKRTTAGIAGTRITTAAFEPQRKSFTELEHHRHAVPSFCNDWS